VLDDAHEALEELRGAKAVHLRVEHDADLRPVLIDAAHLQKLWLGIAASALSLCQGAQLELSAQRDGDGVRLCVRDPERRLDEAELRALLGKDRSRLRRKGLDESHRLRIALWREHAELLGARFELASDERGTSFALRLPGSAAPAEASR